MKRAPLGLILLQISGLVACGGRVLDDREPSEPDTDQPAAKDTPVASAGRSGSSNTGTTTPLPAKELGPCRPGFIRAQNPTRPCHWLTESGRCFDDSDAACNCICPSDRDSVCAHGYDEGPNSATLVLCG